MNFAHIQKYFAAVAAAFALAFLGCSMQQPDGPINGPDQPAAGPIELAAPKVQYEFYKLSTEEALKNDTMYGYVIAKAKSGFKEARFEELGFQIVGRIPGNGFDYYHLYKEGGVIESIQQAMTMSGIINIEPEEALHHCGAIEADPRTASEQYSVFITQAFDAWDTYGFGPHKPYTAIVDSGINFGHEEFKGNVVNAYSWYQDNGTTLRADDTTTPMTGSQPFDYMRTASTSTDGHGHGTHVAGIVGAIGDNGVGMAGVCWNVNLISYKGMSNSGSGGTWSVYGSLWHLAQWKKANNINKTICVNMSLGGANAQALALDMLELCLANNIVIVAATGNEGRNMVRYPAAYSGIIAVGASNALDRRAQFSTHGQHVSVVAPGQGIISAGINGTDHYVSNAGTSMAAPFVTGLVNYMLTFNPYLRPDQIKTYLEENTDYIDGTTGFTPEYGHGRVNVLKTIGAVVNDIKNGTTPPSNYVDERLKITVANVDGNLVVPMPGLVVNLYQCDATGQNIQNYVASTISSAQDYSYWTGGSPSEMESGTAFFRLLRPGYYIAKTYNSMFDPSQGASKRVIGSSEVIEVRPNQPLKDIVLAFREKLLYLQTRPTSATANADSIIRLYNPEGVQVLSVDNSGRGLPEYAYVIMTPDLPTENWRVGVTGLHVIILYTGTGDYALTASVSKPFKIGPAPRTYATVTQTTPQNGEVRGGQVATTASGAAVPLVAQPLPLDVEAYGNLTGLLTITTVHYYRLVFD